jgi:phosphopantothenoylcysteine synthetase/decarboxylase
MTGTGPARFLKAIVCGAGPAPEVGRLVGAAQRRGWDVQIIATPAALEFIDVPALESQTGRPVLSRYRDPGEPRSRRADAIIVAPATYNTINKFAAGICDTYALGLLAEAPGLRIPTVVLPFVNSSLAERHPFRRSVEALRSEGVRVLLGAGEIEPHPPGAADENFEAFPWLMALAEAERLSAASAPL